MTRLLLADGAIDLRLGRWQDVLADVTACDAIICDPPYSERTHASYADMNNVARRSIDYMCFDARMVDEFVHAWPVTRCRGWFLAMSDHVLVPTYEDALGKTARYVFSPLACVEEGSRVRIVGDGPAQWSVWLNLARPATREFQRWGALRGAYVIPAGDSRRGKREGNGVMGGKPIALMRQLVRDYTREGDLVVDPFGGGFTTAIACALEGRRCITCEVDPETFEKGCRRVEFGALAARDPRALTLPFNEGVA